MRNDVTMAGEVRTRGRTIDGESAADIRRLRESEPDEPTAEDIAADAVIALYNTKIVRTSIDELALIVDLHPDVLRRAQLRRLERLAHPVTVKMCGRCFLRKRVEMFNRVPSAVDGRSKFCSSCADEVMAEREAARASADALDEIPKGKRGQGPNSRYS